MPRVLLVDASAPILAALRRFLEGLAELQTTRYLDEAVQVARARPPDVVFAAVSANFDGEALAAQLRKIAPQASVVLLYPQAETRAAERALAAGADHFLVGPQKQSAVVGAMRTVLQLRELKLKIAGLEAEVVRLKGVPRTPARPVPLRGSGVNTHDETFFKKYLLLEVKRSKRYRYPSAVLFVAIDRLAERLAQIENAEGLRERLKAEVLGSIGELVRDIDVAVPFGEDKVLVFLPHTPRPGALVVAGRMVERLSRVTAMAGVTASIGVASFDPKSSDATKVSFGALMRDASAALKAAQAAGGNQAQATEQQAPARRDRVSIG